MSDIMVGARFISLSYYHGHYGLEVTTSKEKFWIKFGSNPLAVALFMQANEIKHFFYNGTVADNAERYSSFTLACKSIGYEV